MIDVVIIGAGGFGREVFQWAKDSLPSDYRIKGFLTNNPNDLDGHEVSCPILGDPKDYRVHENDRFLIAAGDVAVKKLLVEIMREKGARFLSLIHKTAIVAPSARIGEGVILCPFALISDNVVLSDFVMMNVYASCGHDARVGKYSVMSGYAAITGHVILEDEVFLATHATVIPGKRVGTRSLVSANSVVMRNVPPRSLVYGVPGKISRNFVA